MSLIHLARQGFITKSALPNVTRQRGTTTGTANLMLYGAGKTHSIGTNTTFTDSSSNNFTVTRNGDTIQATNNPFTGSVYFDGNGDYLTVPNNTALNPGTGDFTLEVWVYFNALTQGNIFDGNTNGMSLALDGSNRISFGQSNVAYLVTDTVAMTTGSWFHIVAVRSGTTLSLFKNGSRVATATNSSNFTTGTINRIGWNGFSAYFDGYLSNLRIVKGTAVYSPSSTTITVPTSPLTAITNTQLLLLTAQQAPFRDSSSNNFTVTANGNAAGSGLEPFPVNYAGSAYFDGTGDYLSVADNAALELGSNNFTIELFLNTSSSTQYDCLIAREPGGTAATGWFTLLINNNSSTAGDVAFWCWDYNNYSGPMMVTSIANIRDSAWHHIALVRNGSNWNIYIDGVSRASVTSSITIGDINASYWIGANQQVPTQRDINAYISNFRYVVGSAVYTAAFTPPSAPLTAVTNTQLLLLTNNVGPFVDTSANGFPVLRNGDAVQTGFSPFTGQPSAGSAYFDGTGDYLTVPNFSALQLTNSTAFTIECWVYPTNLSGAEKFIIENYNQSFPYPGYGIRVTIPGNVEWWEGGASWVSTGITLTLNEWAHIAVTYEGSGTTRRFFKNGVLSGSAGTVPSGINYTAGACSIGAQEAGLFPWIGYISNLRVTKGTALYTSNFTPATAPLPAVTNTSLLLNTDNYTIANSTPTYLPVTVNGNTTISTAQYPTGMNRSIYFDGNGDYLQVPDNTAFAFGTGDFTVELFINFSILNSNVGYVSSYNGPTTGWYIRNDSANTFVFGFGDTALVSTTWTKSTNTWYHISATRSGTTLKLFIDGVESASVTNSTNITSSGATLKIGALAPQLGSYANWFFTGYISNVRIVKGSALYTSNFTPPAAPLSLSVTVPNFVTNNIYGVYQLA